MPSETQSMVFNDGFHEIVYEKFWLLKLGANSGECAYDFFLKSRHFLSNISQWIPLDKQKKANALTSCLVDLTAFLIIEIQCETGRMTSFESSWK